MSGFYRNTTQASAGSTIEANVSPYGWTGVEAQSISQIIDYVNQCKGYADEAATSASLANQSKDLCFEYVNEAKAWAEKSQTSYLESKYESERSEQYANKSADIYNAFLNVAANQRIVENFQLTEGQLVVNLTKIFADAAYVNINGQRVDSGYLAKGLDYDVTDVSQITLKRSYPVGTLLSVSQDIKKDDTPDTGGGTYSVWNRRIVQALIGVRYQSYEEGGRTLLPRLSFGEFHYLPLFDATDEVTITGTPVLQGTDELKVPTNKGDKIFSKKISEALALGYFMGPDGKGLDEVYLGGGWTGDKAGSGNLQGNAHTNAQKIRYDLKQNSSLDTILWVEKESISERGDTTSGDTGWDGGAGYFSVKKKSGSAPVNVLTGYGRHEGGASNGIIGVLGRGSGQVDTSEVWGVWSYAEVGFGARDTGVTQCIALESNTCNRGPDKGWMAGTGAGASRGVLSMTADGTNRCTHGFYTGNHKASGGLPGTGGWWTGYLVGQNSIAANTNSTTTYVGDGEAFRVNGSGRQEGKYGGFRFHKGFFNYGTSYIEGSYTNNCAILMGPGKRIVWGSHAGSSHHMDYNEETNTLSINNTSLGINGTKVIGQRVLGIAGLAGTADGSSKSTETMTLQELARYVKALSDALRTHGLVGLNTKELDD